MLHKGTVRLETPRLILRKFETKDADAIFRNWASDPEASRFWSWQPHADISVTKAILKSWIGEYAAQNYYHWAIEYRETRENVGYIYLDSIDETQNSAAVHFLISRLLWNKGIMTEACAAVLSFALAEVGFSRIVSWHHADNPASGRVMEKCGMKYIKTQYRMSESHRLSGDYLFYEIEKI